MALCVSCKACRRECPTGVDMARMKIEVQAARAKRHGLSLHDRLVGFLPAYAPYAARVPWLMNLRDRLPGAARVSETIAGFSARRSLPAWRGDWFRDEAIAAVTSPLAGEVDQHRLADVDREGGAGPNGATAYPPPHPSPTRGEGAKEREVVLLADTFNRYFEPENLRAAMTVLAAGGYRVHVAKPADGTTRPLCCGRTFLAVGRVDRARREASRVLAAVAPFVARGVPVLGLEPSCLLTFRDEVPAMLPGEAATQLAAHAMLVEEFLASEMQADRLQLPLHPVGKHALLHGHCHQKAFDALSATQQLLRQVPELAVETIESSCCGMAGSFGYHADTIDVSLAMGELSLLLPAVRAAGADTIVVADGTSCRHQIRDGSGRSPVHAVRLLADSITGMRH